jgi:hypothetical protein
MRGAVVLFSSILLLSIPGLAQTDIAVDDLAHHPIALDFPAGGQLEMHLRSGDIHIVGGGDGKISVRASGRWGGDSTDIHARFERSGDFGRLRVAGGPSSDVTITVQVPKNSGLRVHITAGGVEVKEITGNKDVELGAGDLNIDVGSAADYAHVTASVTSGGIDAAPFGESRGGLFRSFEKFGGGKYKLAAHVGAGQLTLR